MEIAMLPGMGGHSIAVQSQVAGTGGYKPTQDTLCFYTLAFSVCLSSLSLNYHVVTSTTSARSRESQISSKGRLLGALIMYLPGISKGQD